MERTNSHESVMVRLRQAPSDLGLPQSARLPLLVYPLPGFGLAGLVMNQ
jgi:hypothetical protein